MSQPNTFDPLASPTCLTAGLPGIGGKIKHAPEDFEVEEIPAYQPCGEGEFLYLWLEKRDMGAEYFVRQVARRLEIPGGEVGTAGLKDRRAITRQWVSVPAYVEDRLGQLEGDGIQVKEVSRHKNKLKPGHLHGNRFRVLVRDVKPEAQLLLEPITAQLQSQGFPNYYGPQRFGRAGETLQLGMSLLHGESKRVRSGFLRRLALSSAQSGLYNHYLSRRLRDGFFRRVLPGDVMMKRPFGGMFVADDVAAEQSRFDACEIVHAGPIFGRKTFAARLTAAARESEVLEQAGFSPDTFHHFGKLLQGTRRPNVVYLDDWQTQFEKEGIRFTFTLPAGSYATILLRELMKEDVWQADEAEPSE